MLESITFLAASIIFVAPLAAAVIIALGILSGFFEDEYNE